ncbi:MAG TPA: DUF3710 domain-containing protein [Streptosporangiaceae bacterium]|nr:DUF3710 domain-containing protein [Streptosporangiaceae bacterium]
MFRRRRSSDAGLPEDEFGDDESFDDESVTRPARPGGPMRAEGGPWDADEAHPDTDRVDLGSLLVPRGQDYEVQLVMAEQQAAWVRVAHDDSQMVVQAFAAARRGALWEDIRAEIATEVEGAGGTSEESPGPFGPELVAEVPADPNQPESGMRLVRFVGIDGPRWFVRALFEGPAAAGGAPAMVLEDVLRDIVVVRGEHPVPPRDILELRLPPEVRQAFEEQAAAAAEENRFRTDLSPFQRGPEFTETR